MYYVYLNVGNYASSCPLTLFMIYSEHRLAMIGYESDLVIHIRPKSDGCLALSVAD